jgi:hypothetical protein
LEPELAAAFERFLVKPETTDKRCAANVEILKALCALEHAFPFAGAPRPRPQIPRLTPAVTLSNK